MEQIIEFPIEQQDIFSQPLELQQGYCICYQYHTDENGYGPYGFHTAKAEALLNQIFEPLVYWHPERKNLIDVQTPRGDGIYFFKKQAYIETLQNELSTYKQAKALQTLRSKYGRSADIEITSEPKLFSISKKQKIQSDVISNLLTEHCSFFISYFYITEAGQTLIFFDQAIKEKIKNFAKSENINYRLLNSIDELKPW